MPETSPITPEQRASYEENGYVVLRGLLQPTDLKVWTERLDAIIHGRVDLADGMIVMRDVMVAKGAVSVTSREKAIAKLQDFGGDPVLFSYVTEPRILDIVEALIGPDIATIHNMLINKPPGVDGRHPLHQDLLYFPFRPADSIVASWTALEPCTRANGCLVVVPGTHKGELLEHDYPDWEYVNHAYFGARVGAHPERVHLEMDPGDTVFFHPVLLHGSGTNRTDGFRRAISAHYASAACRYMEGTEPEGDTGRPHRLVRGNDHPGGFLTARRG